MNLKQVFPIFGWVSDYDIAHLRGDLFAGITVGIMLIPQGMAYALIAGLPPVYGLYAAIVPQVIYAIFGTSRQLSVGPVAMDSLLVAAGVSVIASEGTDTYLVLAVLLAFMVGVIQLGLGLLQLGFITNLLSRPVIVGFTSAAAIIIGLNQVKYLIGADLPNSKRIYEVLSQLSNVTVHWMTLAIGIVGILLIAGVKRLHIRIPGSLIAVVLGILAVYFLGLHNAGVDIVRIIPDGLPAFQWPGITLERVAQLLPLSFTIAIVGYMEAYSVAKAVEGRKTDHKVRPNQELIGLGAANLVGSLFQSYPVTGGFSRTAVNFESGANTPMSSLISAALVGMTLIFLTPLFYYLPKAILASVIIVAVTALIDLRYILQLWHDSKIEFVLLVGTFLVTINIGMVTGIVMGIVLSILYLLYKSAYPHIAILGRVRGHHEFRNIRRFTDLEVWDNMLLLRVDAPLTFINIQYFRDFIESQLRTSDHRIDTIILDAGPVSHIDASASQGFKDLLDYLGDEEIKFLLCDLIGPVRDTIHRTGLIGMIGKENIFLDLDEALRYLTTHDPDRFKDFAVQSNV